MLGDWGSQSTFQFIPKVFDGVEVRDLCKPVKFFHTNLDKPFLYGPRFVHGGIVMLTQERAFSKLLPQKWKHRIVWNVIVCCRFPFTGTKGPSPNHEKQPQTIPPPPNVTVGTMHWGR